MHVSATVHRTDAFLCEGIPKGAMLKKIALAIGLIIVLIIIVAVVAASCSTSDDPNEPQMTDGPAPLVVTVQEVYDAYQANEARANDTYKNRPLEVSFVVDEIEDDHVVQKLEEFFVEANLSFDKEFLITMEIGDTGTATCQLKGFELDFLLRFDCR